MHIEDPDVAASAGAHATVKHARKADVTDQTKHGAKSPAVTDEPKADLPPELQPFFQAAAGLITFDYTPEQWMEIAKSIQHFLAKPNVYEKALFKLRDSARTFYLETLNRPGLKRQEKWRLNHWTKADKLADALMREFFWLARDERANGPPHPTGKEPYRDELNALLKVSVTAKSHVVSLGGRIADGYPKTTAKTAYQSIVLDVWTELGGELKFSRHPRTGKVKGPLTRYFSAVTQPVHGGSPESLPDAIERHVALKTALDKWRLDQFTANYQP